MTAPVSGTGLALTVRYDQDPGSTFVTDEFRRYDADDHTLLALVDTNGVPEILGAELRRGVFDEITQQTGRSTALEQIFQAVRSHVTGWFRQTALPSTGCFVNVGLLQVLGPRVRFTGAYVPMFVLSPASPTRCVNFPGPVLGPPGMVKFPLSIEEIEVASQEHPAHSERRAAGEPYVRPAYQRRLTPDGGCSNCGRGSTAGGGLRAS